MKQRTNNVSINAKSNFGYVGPVGGGRSKKPVDAVGPPKSITLTLARGLKGILAAIVIGGLALGLASCGNPSDPGILNSGNKNPGNENPGNENQNSKFGVSHLFSILNNKFTKGLLPLALATMMGACPSPTSSSSISGGNINGGIPGIYFPDEPKTPIPTYDWSGVTDVEMPAVPNSGFPETANTNNNTLLLNLRNQAIQIRDMIPSGEADPTLAYIRQNENAIANYLGGNNGWAITGMRDIISKVGTTIPGGRATFETCADSLVAINSPTTAAADSRKFALDVLRLGKGNMAWPAADDIPATKDAVKNLSVSSALKGVLNELLIKRIVQQMDDFAEADGWRRKMKAKGYNDMGLEAWSEFSYYYAIGTSMKLNQEIER